MLMPCCLMRFAIREGTADESFALNLFFRLERAFEKENFN